ncbi:uncharacterized protein CMU_029880 [Cryptosporidium muris RN66]|uniref:RRM domain-containing protein n=1 Tax=Cryptosporidium muris (strain RN66) TaxID=441375 RepID=B6AI72_CRYMR|nr:uncharacterized protein CMU_029880 [Cryptosporidium muris RN66]EEA07913.1 hypothetical protein, conserved [Cryptosporidium muris RN66]|eukprot:XP_002142262.1 hypothetical protein [Cryptosporidium muris RN66]
MGRFPASTYIYRSRSRSISNSYSGSDDSRGYRRNQKYESKLHHKRRYNETYDRYRGSDESQFNLYQRERTGYRQNRHLKVNYERSFSSEREQSRERERCRRRSQAECIRRAGGYQKLAQSEGKDPTPVFYDGFQWVAKTGSIASMDPAEMNNTRKLRRLYFGNLPLHLGLNEHIFQDIVWKEMITRNMCNNPKENPILCVWFAQKKGTYGFVEFRTVEETERALNLDGMNCMGVQIKVSRPNDYSQVVIPQNQAIALLGQQSVNMLLSEQKSNIESPNINSSIMRLIQVVTPSNIEDIYEYDEIFEDVKEGCEKFGKILSGRILKPGETEELNEVQKIRNNNITLNTADVFLEFESSNILQYCLTSMLNRSYEGKPLKMEIFDQSIYRQYIVKVES